MSERVKYGRDIYICAGRWPDESMAAHEKRVQVAKLMRWHDNVERWNTEKQQRRAAKNKAFAKRVTNRFKSVSKNHTTNNSETVY